MPNIQLADNLRFLRKEKGLSQQEMEEVLNLSRQAYSNYERCERTPDLDVLVRLSQFYSTSIDAMILMNLCTLPKSELYSGSVVKETISPYYTYTECKETGNSVYLTKDELRLISDFRSLPDETKQILTGFISNELNKKRKK